jgi:hypothetical protein
MKKCIIISDSHGDLDNIKKIFERETKVDYTIHLGDLIGQDEMLEKICKCEIFKVRGNCDFYSDNPIFNVVEIGNNKIFITHGHNYGVDFGMEHLYNAAREKGCNVAMYGHTHVPENSTYGGMIIVNPGSVSRPRQLNRKPTYAVLTVDNEGKTHINIRYV